MHAQVMLTTDKHSKHAPKEGATMKGLHLLTLGDCVYVFGNLQAEDALGLIIGHPMLAAWNAAIEQVFKSLAQLPRGIDGADANPDDVPAASTSPNTTATTPETESPFSVLDRLTEASIRALRNGLIVGADLAFSQQNAGDAAKWEAAESFLFENGLGFFRNSYPEQIGETVRILQRAQDASMAWLHTQFHVHGYTFAALLNIIRTNNQALNDAINEPTNAPEISKAILRRNAQKLLKDLIPVVNRAYPANAANTTARDTLLKPLQNRIQFRITKRANEKKADDAKTLSATPTTAA